jgi:quercetin dioxygenase-like cupin family protein
MAASRVWTTSPAIKEEDIHAQIVPDSPRPRAACGCEVASSGRGALTVFGGHENVSRQTMIALAAGQKLNEHESPGEATVHVLQGRVRLQSISESGGSPGDLLVVPNDRHELEALEDAVVLLTVAKLP